MQRLKAESETEMGAGFPGKFVSILPTQNDELPRREKSPTLASSLCMWNEICGDYLDLAVARSAKMPWFGGDRDQGACVTYKRAKKQGGGSKKEGWCSQG